MPTRRVRPYPKPGFGKAIREARKQRGISQGELARALGVIQATMSHWETEQSWPSDANLKKIGAFLEIEPPLPSRNEKGRRSTRTANCRYCDKEFPVYYGEVFCSRKHSNAWMSESQRGEAGHRWKGGRRMDMSGYVHVLVRDHPNADRHGYVREHRLVMEKILGRYLTRRETVHHKNGDRADNRPENLEFRVGRHGPGASEKHCPTCTCFDH